MLLEATNELREQMVSTQIEARGVRDPLVLAAMRKVPRDQFVPEHLRNAAYDDMPLPIESGQTVAQPYIVAYMIEALGLKGGEKVLEVGAGSGYTAAILAEIAATVYTMERLGPIAEKAAAHIRDAGYENVHVRHADGTQGWVDMAPFDVILVSAGTPQVPRALLRQLSVGGRMVAPLGRDPRAQELVRIIRRGEEEFEQEDLADVCFVPLAGRTGWKSEHSKWETARPGVAATRPSVTLSLPERIAKAVEPFEALEDADLEPLLARIGEARVVLIGEATHGTSEFYRMRARITERLIEDRGFNIVAVEADWPDAARIDHYVRHRGAPASGWMASARFPAWMWRNEEIKTFIDWLHIHNEERPYAERAAFYGLDLYSLYGSAERVIAYLEGTDAALAALARTRYGCLSPWEGDPAAYGRAALAGAYRNCEEPVARMLADLQAKKQEFAVRNGEQWLDATQNARLIANAERYYRTMYYGSRAAWNLRDAHMFETLNQVMQYHGAGCKAVVWAHNSHVGDATATEMSARGEVNIGQLCRDRFGPESYHIGLGTYAGTVAAAAQWDEPMTVMPVQPAHPQSYERLFHMTGIPGLLLPLRANADAGLREGLERPRLERAIGVVYRPHSELASHYFEAVLPRQFDEYIWMDQTSAVEPLPTEEEDGGLPDTYPFGL